jgi:hypothetical protein
MSVGQTLTSDEEIFHSLPAKYKEQAQARRAGNVAHFLSNIL